MITPEQITESLGRVRAVVSERVIGQEAVIDEALVAFLARGHALLEGVPGTAKTLLVRVLAGALNTRFGRIQFTPDLMPADITGINVLRDGGRSAEFRPGPVFTDLLLADEINRAPAKTQASLLEAMQECAVTIDGLRHPLPAPFCVFATMNPIEHEGTYPLPEAQLDRFLFKLRIGYPSADVETRLLGEAHRRPLNVTPADLGVGVVSSPEELLALRARVLAITVRDDLPAYVVSLVRATRSEASLVLGASTRAGVMLLLAAKARAALQAREFVTQLYKRPHNGDTHLNRALTIEGG